MLIAYGAPPTQAAAAVVVYHAIAFWIPSLGGLLGYAVLRRRESRQTEHSGTVEPLSPDAAAQAGGLLRVITRRSYRSGASR